jgi:hypothetical protein
MWTEATAVEGGGCAHHGWARTSTGFVLRTPTSPALRRALVICSASEVNWDHQLLLDVLSLRMQSPPNSPLTPLLLAL